MSASQPIPAVTNSASKAEVPSGTQDAKRGAVQQRGSEKRR